MGVGDAVAQLRMVEDGKMTAILRVFNIVIGLLGLGVAGVWHVYHIVTCEETTSAEGDDVSDDCMDFFGALSSIIIALYIMSAPCPPAAGALRSPADRSACANRLRRSPLSAILVMFEVTRGSTQGKMRGWLEHYTGFIYLFNRRYQFLILCAPIPLLPLPALPRADG